MLRAVCFSLIVVAETVSAQDIPPITCKCGPSSREDVIYLAANPKDNNHLEDFLWRFKDCAIGIDPIDDQVKVVVSVTLIVGDDIAFSKPFQTVDEQEIFVDGAWVTFYEFEKSVQNLCYEEEVV